MLSSRLERLAAPALGSAPRAEQAAKLSISPEGPGSLLREGGRLLVDVLFERGAVSRLDELRDAGARIVAASSRYQWVTVALRPDDLRNLAAVRGVSGASESLAPLVLGSGEPPAATAALPDCPGSATSEGDSQLRAVEAREAFGVDGTGVTVGILSDSFDRDGGAETDASADVASGDLPGPGNPCGRTAPVDLLDDAVAGSDEGRAMAQIVHDLAPGAKLAFATAFTGELAFAANIERLARPVAEGGAAAQAIVDDVIYFAEPFFQDGPVAVAADRVTEAGVPFFSAAGNNNLIDAGGNDIASWEAPAYRDSPSCPAELNAAAGSAHCMDYDPGAGADNTFGITVSAGATLTVDLQWAEPWNGVQTDLDAFLLDASGTPLKAGLSLVGSFDDNVGVTEQPVEVFQWQNKTGSAQSVQLAVDRCFGTCNPGASGATAPRLKLVLLQNGGGVTATEYPQASGGDAVGPTIFGHSATPAAIGVGAVRYNTTTKPESFSSRGPVAHYFGPVQGSSPAPALGAPATIAKPDLAATDGGANTFFGSLSSGVWRFFGTSAAAPHAAAVAALLLDRNPSLSPKGVRDALVATARPVGAFGPSAVGAGLVDAMEAVGAVEPAEPPGEEPPEEEEEEEGEEGETIDEGGTVPPPVGSSGSTIANAFSPRRGRAGDRVAPRAFFRQRPPAVLRTTGRGAKALFRFGSDQAGATFSCRIDAGSVRPCRSTLERRFSIGAHVVRVRARGAAGNTGPFAVDRFRVRRMQG